MTHHADITTELSEKLAEKNSFVKQERRMVTKNAAELKLLHEGTL